MWILLGKQQMKPYVGQKSEEKFKFIVFILFSVNYTLQ